MLASFHFGYSSIGQQNGQHSPFERQARPCNSP